MLSLLTFRLIGRRELAARRLRSTHLEARLERMRAERYFCPPFLTCFRPNDVG